MIFSSNGHVVSIALAAKPAANVNAQAEIMNGKPIAKDIRSRVAAEICRLKAATGRLPGLAVVLVGNRKDSHNYVNLKLKACNQVGIVTSIVQLPQDCTQDRLIDVVSSFNRNPSVHGIIVQLPLPQVLLLTGQSSFCVMFG